MATLAAAYRKRTATGPVLTRTRVMRGGTRIALKYDLRVSGSSPAAFRIDHGISPVPVAGVQVRGKSVTIDLAGSVPAATARVSYLDPTGTIPWISGLRGEGAALLFEDVGRQREASEAPAVTALTDRRST